MSIQQEIFLVFFAILAGLCALNLLFAALLSKKINALVTRERALMKDIGSGGLEGMLKETLNKISGIDKQYEEVKFFEEKLLEKLPPCIQKVGLVRFNAFTDIGGDQSFALALLDGKNKGIVISSLYGRNEARVYAKPVESGKSAYPLSEEEQKALSLAKNQ